MDTVWDALSGQSEIIAEVPTGIGKTMAYLLPAAIRFNCNGKACRYQYIHESS